MRTPSLFARKFFDAKERFMYIGSGSLGGKAQGLVQLDRIIERLFPDGMFEGIEVSIPSLAVIRTDLFETFIKRNRLEEIAGSDEPDRRILMAFQEASLPTEVLGDLLALIEHVHTPLAIRSSSLLEDRVNYSFAGIYQTKMIPNNQVDSDARFARLTEAIKFVYASAFTKAAKDYRHALPKKTLDEAMAVIIQEVVGKRHGDRFYPEISGVARSYNFYPVGASKPEEGVAQLALGLGKTIVDGGLCWTYSPAFPHASPPFANPDEMADNTQNSFWAVSMTAPREYNPLAETEYLLRLPVPDAEKDKTIDGLVSTYNFNTGRVSAGTSDAGVRILTFAPLLVLRTLPFNELLLTIMQACENTLQTPVEIEFAMTFDPPRFACLQVRPMLVSGELVDVDFIKEERHRVFLFCERVCGNGEENGIREIVYVKPETFEMKYSQQIAHELEAINHTIVKKGGTMLLVGYGRWGSSDPWLGIPITWGQISSARSIVEATLPSMNVDLSQGSHFFHNLVSFGISYFSASQKEADSIDWQWLGQQDVVQETPFVRHVRLRDPLCIKVDGRSGRGVILKR